MRAIHSTVRAKRAIKVWIDLDNTPHVPFFRPIIRELEARGHSVVLTARNAFQVCELADHFGLDYKMIGRHYGKRRLSKIWGLGWRSLQLLPFMLQQRPTLALSHGARSQILLCNVLRVPTIMLMDYEYVKTPFLVAPRWEIVPQALLGQRLHCADNSRILTYDGIKEDVYVPEFQPDSSISSSLGLDKQKIIVTVRPPANEAHYHNPESDALFVAFMERVVASSETQVVLLPRNDAQNSRMRNSWPHWFVDRKVLVPSGAIDGLSLLHYSDLVVSGGGTMNREAAALGVPVYGIFRGKIGAIDRQLSAQGKLILIETIDDISNKIPIRRRDQRHRSEVKGSGSVVRTIVNHVEDIDRKEH